MCFLSFLELVELLSRSPDFYLDFLSVYISVQSSLFCFSAHCFVFISQVRSLAVPFLSPPLLVLPRPPSSAAGATLFGLCKAVHVHGLVRMYCVIVRLVSCGLRGLLFLLQLSSFLTLLFFVLV